MKRLSEEERNQLYLDLIHKYFNKEEYIYDFITFASAQKSGFSKDINKWMEFAKNNLSDEEYQRFYHRVFILEPKLDGSDVKEKEELKIKVAEIAEKIRQGEATMFDIIDNITPSMAKYMSMVKELRYRYGLITMSVYEKNYTFFHIVKDYMKDSGLGISYRNLSVDDASKVKQFINSYNLPINDITFKEAVQACVNRGLVTLKKDIRN